MENGNGTAGHEELPSKPVLAVGVEAEAGLAVRRSKTNGNSPTAEEVSTAREELFEQFNVPEVLRVPLRKLTIEEILLMQRTVGDAFNEGQKVGAAGTGEASFKAGAEEAHAEGFKQGVESEQKRIADLPLALILGIYTAAGEWRDNLHKLDAGGKLLNADALRKASDNLIDAVDADRAKRAPAK